MCVVCIQSLLIFFVLRETMNTFYLALSNTNYSLHAIYIIYEHSIFNMGNYDINRITIVDRRA